TRRLFIDIRYPPGRVPFAEHFVPLLRGSLPPLRRFAVFINDPCFQDVEYLLGVNIAAGLAMPTVTVNLVARFLEVRDGFYRGTVIRKVSAGIHDYHLVEHLVDIR